MRQYTSFLLIVVFPLILIFSLLTYLHITQEPPVNSGKIEKKYHKDATRKKGNIMVGKLWMPTSRNIPERWVFVLENCEDLSKACRRGEVEVSKEVYNGLEVGDQYPSKEFLSK